ncbi:hypothetical protein KUTeg_000211 [Tegillarca granosa]|uniref:Major facilitator superfamily (MFS) profile domain-containing protein n=1 Tax=Tegillarca granosa TaxID=220873 RepID=A0ABQ9FWX6_TEGGR|nr:hypothetical protein KUTeg_000211 [Tegillarca granosa]
MTFQDGSFLWDRDIQAKIVGAFFLPYAIFQVPGAIVVTKLGSHKVFGCVLVLTSVITLLTPIISRVHYIGTIVLRFLLGALTSVTYVNTQYLLGRWVPIQERSRLSALSYSGIEMGILVTYAISGFLCEHGFDGGWPSIFYIHG